MTGTEADAQRARELRFHKRRATALLILATVIYLIMVVTTNGEGWRGYVEAGAEAAMVGGIADWFAVTALFRHPLRLPIPHTAIVPKRKDEIGRALGEFVQENFLQGDLLEQRLSDIAIASRLGEWLERPENARRVGDQATAVLNGIFEVLRDDQLQNTVDTMVRSRVDDVDLAPIAGRVVDFTLDGGHHRMLFDSALSGVHTMLDDNRSMLRSRLEKESPWWVPEQIDQRVFDRIYEGIESLVAEINNDPNHEVRGRLDARFRRLAHDLKESPELAERAEAFKQEMLNHPDVRVWTNNLWLHIKDTLLAAADDPNSDLRERLHEAAVNAGTSLRTDPELQAKVDRWATGIAVHLANESSSEVADFIATTVEGWDADETSWRIETQIGRDLQYIRINGTLVGGLAGLVIHAVSELIA